MTNRLLIVSILTLSGGMVKASTPGQWVPVPAVLEFSCHHPGHGFPCEQEGATKGGEEGIFQGETRQEGVWGWESTGKRTVAWANVAGWSMNSSIGKSISAIGRHEVGWKWQPPQDNPSAPPDAATFILTYSAGPTARAAKVETDTLGDDALATASGQSRASIGGAPWSPGQNDQWAMRTHHSAKAPQVTIPANSASFTIGFGLKVGTGFSAPFSGEAKWEHTSSGSNQDRVAIGEETSQDDAGSGSAYYNLAAAHPGPTTRPTLITASCQQQITVVVNGKSANGNATGGPDSRERMDYRANAEIDLSGQVSIAK